MENYHDSLSLFSATVLEPFLTIIYFVDFIN